MTSQYHYYFLLLRRAYIKYANKTEISISMNDLVKILYCSQRNVKIILNKLIEDGLIQFRSGKGRGNTSIIIFLEDFHTSLHKLIKAFIQENEVNKALELVKEFGHGTEAEAYVIHWIKQFFGYNKVQNIDQDLEVLRFPIFRPITTVDPTKIFFDFDAHLVEQVFNTLVQYDFNTRTFRACLAHTWESNQEHSQWLFYLRKGVKFHNGKELTAEVVKRSMLRLKSSPHKWLVEDIELIKTLSKNTIFIKLKNPNYLFLHYVSFTPMSIVDASTHEGFLEYQNGTGPFKIEQLLPNYCVLTAFDNYFAYRPHLDRVEIIQLSQEFGEAFLDRHKIFLDTGEVQNTREEKWHDKKRIFSGTSVLALNTVKNGPLKNKNLRKLINHVIDRTTLTDLGKTRLIPANGFVVDNEERLLNDILITETSTITNDHVAKVGYAGEALTVITYTRHAMDAECIRNQLNHFGINLNVKIMDWDKIQNSEMINEADMILFEGTPNEGVISVFDLLLYEQGFVYPFLSEELKIDIRNRVSDIKREKDEKARLFQYRDLEKTMVDQGVLIFLVHKQVEVSYEHSLEGVQFNSRMWVDFNNIWYKYNKI